MLFYSEEISILRQSFSLFWIYLLFEFLMADVPKIDDCSDFYYFNLSKSIFNNLLLKLNKLDLFAKLNSTFFYFLSINAS